MSSRAIQRGSVHQSRLRPTVSVGVCDMLHWIKDPWGMARCSEQLNDSDLACACDPYDLIFKC